MAPEKGQFRTMAIKPGRSSQLDVEVDGFSKMNSPLGVEMLLQESFSMGSGGKGRRKETKRIFDG